VKKSGTFVVPGLGRFVIRPRKARTGGSHLTNESIQIKPKTIVKFKPAKTFGMKSRRQVETGAAHTESGTPACTCSMLAVETSVRGQILFILV